MNRQIDILLPVYNGGLFLKEQIESILNQTYENWRLLIRNDGSTDDSQFIIDDYCKRFPDKIIEIKDNKGNVGLLGCLNVLLEKVNEAEYIMFCDQDDIWLDNKVEISLKEIINLESDNKPALICSDVKCVDENLNVINDSFFKSQKFSKDVLKDYNRMAALNIVQGCTIMINKQALQYIRPLPKFLNVHDAWVAILCKQLGNVKYIDKPTMLYRQHGNNELGEISIDSHYYLSRFRKAIFTLKLLFKISGSLPYKLNIMKVLYYKFYYAYKRVIKE